MKTLIASILFVIVLVIGMSLATGSGLPALNDISVILDAVTQTAKELASLAQ